MTKRKKKTVQQQIKQYNQNIQKQKQNTASAKPVAEKATTLNKWRQSEGVDAPLRIGRAIRTRDEFFAGQQDKIIHPEIHKDELYRRAIVLEMDDDKNVAVVKTHTCKSKKYPMIPNDMQKRRYEQVIQTETGTNTERSPLRITQDKLELAPAIDDVTEEQAQQILADVENHSKTNKKRLAKFRMNKK